MTMTPKIIIFGGGQIGTACGKFIYDLFYNEHGPRGLDRFEIWDKEGPNPVDIDTLDVFQLERKLKDAGATHVMVAMPFTYNEKIAKAAFIADCHYIDFTEDDEMADKVQTIYAGSSNLICAVKCGLAPGFINYLGHSLVKDVTNEEFGGFLGKCSDLMISVGALPRNVNGSSAKDLYNLSWSVDGLVNEYIRPCRVRKNGMQDEIAPLTGLERVIADGVEYEAAYTSGGIGSLVKELSHVKNVAYKTLRYPTHYDYVKEAVARHHGEFEPLKREFLRVFPFNTDDVIVVYAEAKGVDANNRYVRRSFSGHYHGVDGLSAIQSTTAGGGVAVLEMMINGKLKPGLINHKDIPLDRGGFFDTTTARAAYKKR